MSCGSAGPSTIDLALVHHLAVVRRHVLVLRDQILVRHAVEVGDDEALLALRILAERHRAGDFGQQAGVLRRARLEELRHARQTARDVARLRRLLRDPRQHFADAHLLAVLHRDDRAQLERDVDRQLRAGELDLVALLVEQLDLRPHTLGRRAGAALRIDDDERGQARHFVDLLRDGDAFLDVLELHAAGVLGDDRAGRRVPHAPAPCPP